MVSLDGPLLNVNDFMTKLINLKKSKQSMIKKHKTTWVHDRVENTSPMLDKCFDDGLTGHIFQSREGKTVVLESGEQATEFISCSYLGLEQHPALVKAAKTAIDQYGIHFSSSRNRMRPPFLKQLDSGLYQIYRGKSCISFTSVSSVHLGVLPLLGGGVLPSYPISEKGPFFLIEKTAHASIQVLRGILEQFGPTVRFDISIPLTLHQGLEKAKSIGRTPILLVDGVGSMGGLIDVVMLHQKVKAYQGYLYIDDAHGTSLAGELGEGYAATEFNSYIPKEVLLVGSLSKAFGGAGGYIALQNDYDITVIQKSANPLVFGHSIMLPMLAANVASISLHLSGKIQRQQEILWGNTKLFDIATSYQLENAGLHTPIRGIRFETEEKTYQTALRLKQEGILILPAFFPTVRRGSGLIRFALSSLHTHAQIQHATNVLMESLV